MSNDRPRRRSIFSGVMLILVGTLLLLAQLSPDIRLGRWFLDYWPVLLIVWGLAKLFDYAIARRTGETPPRTLTGGMVFLLIVLICIGTGGSWLRDTVDRNPDLIELPEDVFGFGSEFSFSEEVAAKPPVKAGSLIKIHNYRGEISVHSEETAEIKVVVKKTLRANDDAEAERISKGVSVTVVEVPGGFEIKPELKEESYKRVRLDLEVRVPKSVSVEADTDRGGIQVSGITGSVTANSYKGDVQIQSAGGDVRVDLKGGNVRVQNVQGGVRINGRGNDVEVTDVKGEAVIQGEFYGPIRVQNVGKEVHFLSQRTDLTIGSLPGRMEMGSGDLEVYDTPGNVLLTTRNKDITLENVGGRVRIDNRHGNIQVRLKQPPKEEVDIANESGTVELALPGKSSFELVATSRQGDVESEFQDPGLASTSDQRTNTLQGKVGAGRPRVQLKTTYGGIHIRKVD